jgi:hypothetical protein
MSFPTLVYRCPGPFFGPFGKTYNNLGVNDEKALAAALADGWHKTLPGACGVVADIPADDAPPTRAELEEQATSLGIRFDGRTPDARLARLISDNLQGGS